MSVRGQRIVPMLHSVPADGPHDRHLVPDVGATYTALMVATAGALVSRTPAVTTLAADRTGVDR